MYLGPGSIVGKRARSGVKQRKKKNERAKQALGWSGEGERAQTPARLASLADFFRLGFHCRAWSKARNLD